MNPGTRSLSTQIRNLLLECPSRESFYDRLMKVSADRVHATVARVDYRVGEATQEAMTHDVRMSRDLATRFSTDYLKPFADTLLNGTSTEPQLKRYERGTQSMTLVAAPVMNIADNKVDGVITVMLNGDGHKPELLLPHLDGISSLGSAILVAKTQAMAMHQKQQASAANSSADASSNANSSAPISDEAAAGAAAMQHATALSKAAQFKSTKEFGYSIVNSLCGQLQAEQVIFGIEKGKRIVVEAISGFADFKASSPGVAIVRQSMEECLDHESFVVVQREKLEGQGDALPIHQQWSSDSNNSSICSIPLKQGDETTGVISIRR